MNKSRILSLAQRRALKGESDKEGSSSGVQTGEKGIGPEGAVTSTLASVLGEKRIPLKRTRFETAEGSGRRLQLGESFVSGGRKKSEILKEKGTGETIDTKEVESVLKGSLSSPAVQGEKRTLLRFHTGPGWLSKVPGPTAPVGALGIFELGLDQGILDSKGDDEVVAGVKDALGVLGTYVMNLVERTEKNYDKVAVEVSRAESKERERVRAVKRADELQKALVAKDKELKSEKDKACSVEKVVEEERGTISLLRKEVEKLQEELRKEKGRADKAEEALEKVEKDAAISYKDAVEQFKKSEEFEELVEVKAGIFHEEGFNDCLAFVGAGNVVDLTVHNVGSFRAAELDNEEERFGGGP
ncbi:uncharacterized protein LOC108221922 isoform X2 [Daucus carota subsp. sativus]|nr:PREDICTED: uncharacterized protein LOC108221922 isoform X2 [Daucus carota subsp. sativus]